MPFPLSSPGWCHTTGDGGGSGDSLCPHSMGGWTPPWNGDYEWGSLWLLEPAALTELSVGAHSLIICLQSLWLLLTIPRLCQFPRLLRNTGSSLGCKGSSGCEKPETRAWTCGDDLPSITSTSLSLDCVKHALYLNAYKLLALGLEKQSSAFSCKTSKWSRGVSSPGPVG